MSTTLTLYYFVLPSAKALPIAGIEELASSCDNQRSIWSIVSGCLATIIACTWVAVHPNVPGPNEAWPKVTLRRLQITVMALIAPELVILWAIRQWIMASKLAKEYQEYEWTKAHAFFVIMGGFMLFEGDQAPCTLKIEDLKHYLENGDIDITEEEVQDKSRGDLLSKVVVILQTSWFILQCIARRMESLPITEIELVTLAFASLNFVTYGLWWYKPLDVQCPYPVLRKREAVEGRDGHKQRIFDDMNTNAGEMRSTSLPTIIHRASGAIRDAIYEAIKGAVDYIRQNGVWGTIKKGGTMIFLHSLGPFSAMAWGDDDLWAGDKRVPTFYAGHQADNEKKVAGLVGAVIATFFGGIHCIAWSFDFPSHTEQLVWRVSSLTITCFPLLFFLFFWFGSDIPDWIEFLLGIVVIFIGSIAYVLARLALLVISFTSLRSLPSKAYQAVQWTNFIPHI